MSINIFQALLIGVLYYFADCPWFPNVGYSIFNKPFVLGGLVGIILGDVSTGLAVGIQIQLMTMGLINAGGSMPSDSGLSGTVGAALAIVLAPSLGQEAAITAALGFAVALGMLGTIKYTARMTWCSYFNHLADKAVAKGDLKALNFWNVIVPQICLGLGSVVPCALLCMAAGDATVLGGLTTVLGKISPALGAIGKLLTGVGIALLLATIGDKVTVCVFVIAYIAVKVCSFSTVQIAIIAGLIAYILVFAKGGSVEKADADELPDLE